MTRLRSAALAWLIALPVCAQVAGPALPPPEKQSPAQLAIALAHRNYDPPPLPAPCRQAKRDEITVCANPGGRSPDRIPLPAESGPRDWPRTAIGELPHVGIGGSPVLQGKGAGLTLSIPFGGQKPAPVKVSGNGED